MARSNDIPSPVPAQRFRRNIATPSSQPGPRLFVSHSSKDNNFGLKLVQDLRHALGNDDAVWYDTAGGLFGGDSWWSKIVQELTTREIFILVLSPDAMSSKWVIRELEMAMVEGKRIIPLLYRQCDVRADLKIVQAISFLAPKTYETAFRELLIALSLLEDMSPSATRVSRSAPGNSVPLSKPGDFALLRTLQGHSGAIWSVAISPNAQLLASGSQDTTLKVWNLHTGELLHTLKGYSGTVYSIAISSDTQTLVCGHSDGTLKLWSLDTGELIRTLDEHSNFINTLALSPDGQIIASGSGDNTIKVWDLQAKQLLYTLSESVNSIAISPDGKLLVSGDKMIKVWNLATGELLRTLSGHSRNVNSIAISLDGQIIATGSSDRTIKVWNLLSGKLLRTIRGHTSSVIDIVINSDEQTLASVSYDKSIKVWNLHTGVLLQTLVGHSDNVFRITFSADGQLLASGSEDTTIKIWGRNKPLS